LNYLEDDDKKILLFIGFFGYLRFLNANRIYLSGSGSLDSKIDQIEGIKREDMSP
jgi:hypothetical protein